MENEKDVVETVEEVNENTESLHDQDANDKVSDIFNKAKEQAKDIFDMTKQKAFELSENETFKKAVIHGKEIADQALDVVKDGVDTVKENENVKNILDKTGDKIDEIRTSDSLKNAVDKAEEFTGKANQVIFNGIRKIFKDEE